MSVPISKRGDSDFQIVTCANNICEKVLAVYENEKYIPKRKRLSFPLFMVQKATEVMNDFNAANALTITTNQARFDQRTRYQLQGIANLSVLEHMLYIAWKTYNIPNARMDEIYEDIDYINDKFANWQASDRKQFRDKIKKAELKKAEQSK
jgi:hypothetical protein